MLKLRSISEGDKVFDLEVAFVASTIARSLSALLTYPLDVLKTKMMSEVAIGTQPQYSKIVGSFRYISNSEGFVGLFRGMSFVLYSKMLQAATTTVLYKYLLADKEHNQTLGFLMLSGINFLIHYPIDTFMKNYQLQGFLGNKDSVVGFRNIVKEVAKPGWRAFYNGSVFYGLNVAIIMGYQKMMFEITK